jgi:flagellar biogenesis protein FliO
MILQFNKRIDDAGLDLRTGRTRGVWSLFAFTMLAATTASAQPLLSTNLPAGPELPGSSAVVFSFFRVLGALAFVLAVFFGGVWLFRNWQRTVLAKGQAPRLNILETKSLGQRHALYVVGYEQQRLLIAASPAGVTMLTALPAAMVSATEEAATTKPNFTNARRQALQRKS